MHVKPVTLDKNAFNLRAYVQNNITPYFKNGCTLDRYLQKCTAGPSNRLVQPTCKTIGNCSGGLRLSLPYVSQT